MTNAADYAARNAELFEARLHSALSVARSGNVALVIVPPTYPKHVVISTLMHWLDPVSESHARATQDAVHFQGAKGSVRVYSSDHVEYNRKQNRMIGYPVGIATFQHPVVEESI